MCRQELPHEPPKGIAGWGKTSPQIMTIEVAARAHLQTLIGQGYLLLTMPLATFLTSARGQAECR